MSHESKAPAPTGPELILLIGTAGAGKSTALKALEDASLTCIDNLPVPLLGPFFDHLDQERAKPEKKIRGERFAVLVNCHNSEDVYGLLRVIENLASTSRRPYILFMDARDEIIVQRFRETRRPHPVLQVNSHLKDLRSAAQHERELLAPLRLIADRVIDTSSDSPHDLRRRIQDLLSFKPQLELSLVSFGFKYGIPFDSDMVFDVRFLPNPYYVDALRGKTGKEEAVRNMVLLNDDAQGFLVRAQDFIAYVLPRFQNEGKRYVTISVGCTGGKHRSVAIVENLASFLQKDGKAVLVRHRDIERG